MVKAFVNPATGRYAWVGLDECKVSFLNDFSWSTEIINRSYFRAKQFTCHSQRTSMQLTCPYHTNPFFAPSKEPLEFIGKYNIRDGRESAMMSSCWHTFNLTYQIENAKNVDPCTCCFSKFVSVSAEEDGYI